MPLTCNCDFDFNYEFDPGDWYYMADSGDFIKSEGVSVCQSCNDVIHLDDLCVGFERFGYPEDDKEAKEHGFEDAEEAMEDEATIRLLDHYICETCGEIYLNLQSVGFECISPGENMPELLKQYQHDYAPPKLCI